MSTIDAIFILQYLIQRRLKNKKRFYCCFVDYKKAFDFVNRQTLWFKLIQQGVDGKMLTIIVLCTTMLNAVLNIMMYFRIFCVCKNGLFQGEVLSPILFSMYVND